ncbi:uncharacterized protein [Medicago truncatula]|uniref:uncharacterized protein n=1 Tax=Medicago truncatula TaxID=3880 RepID=UPI001966D321|nr:uncharacterized protein LOC112420767 [Medicago truncatula]
MNSNKRRKVNNGHNPLSDITNGGVAFRKLMHVKPGKHILKHKGGGLYGKENSELLKENNVLREYVSERGKENEVPHNTQDGELRDRRVSIQEMDLDMECNENGEASEIPENSSDVEDNIPATVDNGLSANMDEDFETECYQNNEGDDVPFNELDDDEEEDVMDGANDTDYYSVGEPRFICPWCGAIMWYEERVSKRTDTSNPEFSLCCMQGRIEIAPFKRLPRGLYDLYHNNDKKSKIFLENIRSFNSMFAFTSMGANINSTNNNGNAPPVFVLNGENYHQIGSLLPKHGDQPRFAQLYIYDTDNELSNRMLSVRMEDDKKSIKKTIVKELRHILDNSNSFVKSYRMVRDTLLEDNAPQIKLRILGKRGYDGRRYNLPTASEVAALVVGDYDAADFERDVVVEERSGLLKRISVFETSYLPLQYPLIFSRGEDEFRRDIRFTDRPKKKPIKRIFVSMKEWFAYKIQQRDIYQSHLLYARRLFQQFLVDAFSMIESWRLMWYRNHQKEVRADLYKGLAEAVLRGETSPASAGKRVVLPSKFVGGARYMIQNYQDAMAICGWVGYPDLFITFTCNHKWPELVDFLKKHNLKPEDRPDLVSRLFKIKLDHLIKYIKKGKIFGKVKAVIYTIEFQKRGIPHAHILVFLRPESRCKHPNQIDKIISAEIPDKNRDPRLYDIVASLMIHGPCGPQNTKSPCMLNKKFCTKHFPKKYTDSTVIDSDGYPVYRRRNNGVFIQKGESFVDNRYVVPYNRLLLLKYNAHINVEWCNQSRSIKYLFKYVNKGHDRVTATFYEGGVDTYDEIKMYYDCRYLSACEAAWRIFSFDINYREPSVERLSFHLEGEEPVVFEDHENLEDVIQKPHIRDTKFLAWFEANKKYPEAKDLTYGEFPMKFVWKASERRWSPRQRGISVGRIHFVPPGSGEKFYLRLLLNFVKGPCCYNDIYTVNGKKFNTFKEACFALGLIDDDKEFIDAINQASIWGTASYMRRLFVQLLVSNQFSQPEVVWNKTWQNLSDDMLHRQRRAMRVPDLVLDDDQLKSYTLAEIERLLHSHGKSLKEDYPTMPRTDISLIHESRNRLIYDEMNYNQNMLEIEHNQLMSTMTAEQRGVYDKIISRVDANLPGIFFLYGYGGTGKTFICRALSSAIRSRKEIVLTVASSGIAALLIPGGRTAHSRFGIPIIVDEISTCGIHPKSPLAELVSKAKLII